MKGSYETLSRGVGLGDTLHYCADEVLTRLKISLKMSTLNTSGSVVYITFRKFGVLLRFLVSISYDCSLALFLH